MNLQVAHHTTPHACLQVSPVLIGGGGHVPCRTHLLHQLVQVTLLLLFPLLSTVHHPPDSGSAVEVQKRRANLPAHHLRLLLEIRHLCGAEGRGKKGVNQDASSTHTHTATNEESVHPLHHYKHTHVQYITTLSLYSATVPTYLHSMQPQYVAHSLHRRKTSQTISKIHQYH